MYHDQHKMSMVNVKNRNVDTINRHVNKYVPPARAIKEELATNKIIRHAKRSTLAMVGSTNILFSFFFMTKGSTNFSLVLFYIFFTIQSLVYIY